MYANRVALVNSENGCSLAKSASIQPRTSLRKFGGNLSQCFIPYLSACSARAASCAMLMVVNSLFYFNQKHLSSIRYRSQFDEMCLFVHSKFWIAITIPDKWADEIAFCTHWALPTPESQAWSLNWLIDPNARCPIPSREPCSKPSSSRDSKKTWMSSFFDMESGFNTWEFDHRVFF